MGQMKRVLDFIHENGSISSLDAFNQLGITRLSSVIYDLRKNGHVIESEIVRNVNRYGERVSHAVYRLADNET